MMRSEDKVFKSWIKFLDFEWNYFITITFRDRRSGFIGAEEAFRRQRKFIDRYFAGAYFFSVAEPHRFRDSVHLHTLLICSEAIDDVRNYLLDFKSRVDVKKVNDRAVSYCSKFLTERSDVPIDFWLPRRDKRTLRSFS